MPHEKFTTEIWNGVIGTLLKPKEVRVSGQLALVPCTALAVRKAG